MKKLKDSCLVQNVVTLANNATFPGFQGVSIGTVMAFFHKSITKGIVMHRAAAMTYRIFFALIPLLMSLFAAISFLGSDVRTTIMEFLQAMIPEYVWPTFADMIDGVINKQNGALFYSSLAISLFSVFISINASINILNTTYYNIGKRKLLKQLRVIAMLLFIWMIIILLAVAVFIATSTFLGYIRRQGTDWPRLIPAITHVAKWLLLFFLVYLFISSFYYLAPATHKHFRFFSAGSTFATIAMVLVLAVMNIYFSNFGNYNALYGSLGAVFAILLWLYWNNLVILVGYDLNVSIATAKRATLRDTLQKNGNEKK
ncbi:MAG: YihY/virulence factor BrkB family protein [Bacteroidales bacterium]|jgi:membrane protein|nr:YihY/virulence factor BrkB family protein [Bacteroidales bacterium]MCR5115010.1 YihY/virulence factor BrkB family protein [Bacteroidales bacterium]